VVKSDLVNALNENLPELQKRDVELALNCILGQLENALARADALKSGALVVLIYVIGLAYCA